MAKSPKFHSVMTLRVQIEDIDPPIWRRIRVDSDITLRALHHVIQAAFGWADAHLHEFQIEGRTYLMLDNENVLDMIEEPEQAMYDDRKAKLNRVLYPSQHFIYVYDYGDNWRHAIVVEDTRQVGEPMGHALVIDGARAVPPEDVGGTYGYEEFLNVITRTPLDEEGKRQLEWAGGEFDPERFDRRMVNAALLRMAWNGWGRK